MKKKLLIILIAVFTIGILLPSASFASTQSSNDTNTTEEEEKYKEELSNLTQEEITSNFERINQEYDIGEVFSPKDQTFVKMYAEPVNSQEITTLGSTNIYGSETVNGITVEVSGTIGHDIQNIINHSFFGNLQTNTTAGSDQVSSVETVVQHEAYGLIGSDGIGKVYSGSISSSGANNTLNATENYSGIVAYAVTTATVTVNHSGGTFTVNPQ